MISRGIGILAQGMQAMIDFEDVTAHNLANVTTAGFKKSNITFQDIMQSQVQNKNITGSKKQVGSISIGSRADRTYIDFSQGGLSESGNKLDVAIQGDGFFKVRHQDIPDNAPYNEKNYYYQRTGNFKLTLDNYLVNSEGDYIMDVNNKRIRITRDLQAQDLDEINRLDATKDLIISENGQIEVNNPQFGANLQKIQICDFKDKTKISAIGEGKFLPIYNQDAGLYTKEEGTYTLQQGMIEMSNANTIQEMLNSINISRGYESMSNMLKSQSETVQRAISLGNIGG